MRKVTRCISLGVRDLEFCITTTVGGVNFDPDPPETNAWVCQSFYKARRVVFECFGSALNGVLAGPNSRVTGSEFRFQRPEF